MINSLDETIKIYEKVAEEKEKQAIWLWSKEDNSNYEDCIEDVKKLRQLAEWLRELKMLREVIDNKSFEITDPLDPHRHHVLVVKVTDLYNDFFDF